ncbi:MAG: hypothetical protein KIT22_03005 [Verrucomicrobiae bacterium]|nr:hypothetical protein [Verrucomicrobiae bacterium]
MTVLIGILCSDGVVIGADSSATFATGHGATTIEQKSKKVFAIGNSILIAGTGQVGVGQRFVEAVNNAWDNKAFLNLTKIEYGKHLCNLGITEFISTQCPKGVFGALVAYPCAKAAHLCELAVADFQPEWKTKEEWFVSMGSGQAITDPFLAFLKRVFYKNRQPTVREALFLASWALNHVIELNPGGINGPSQIATITFDTKGSPCASVLTDDQIGEHLDSAEGAEKHLADYMQKLNGSPRPGDPVVPTA